MFSSRSSWLDPVMAIGVAAATLVVSTYFAGSSTVIVTPSKVEQECG